MTFGTRSLMTGARQRVRRLLTATREFAGCCAEILCSLQKAVAVATVGCFLVSFVFGQAAAAVVQEQRDGRQAASLLDDLVVPHSIGRITDAGYFGTKTVVIAVQDLHCHPEVQKNISSIISLFDQKCRLSRVYMEGSSGSVDTSWMSGITDPKARREFVDALLAGGKLTGAEYYAATAGRPDLLTGLEDEKVYDENVLRLNRMMAQQEQARGILRNLSVDLSRIKALHCNGEQKRFDEAIAKYKSGALPAKEYYRLLQNYCERLGIDFNGYESISAYLELLRTERELSFGRITSQIKGFVALLKQELPYATYRALGERTANFTKVDELYIHLARLTKEYRLNERLAADYPDLHAFFNYLRLSRQINPLQLVLEDRKLTREIASRLASDRSGREVVFLADFFTSFDDYFSNRMTAEDYAYFVKNYDDFALLWTKFVDNGKLAALAPYCALAGEYYRVNLQRNGIFLRNMLGGTAAAQAGDATLSPLTDDVRETLASLPSADKVVVMVTGGFHTSGMAQLLKENRLSYIVVTPNVTQDTRFAETVYSRLLTQQGRLLSQALGPKAVIQTAVDPRSSLDRQLLFFTNITLPSLRAKSAKGDIETWMNFLLREWGKQRAQTPGNAPLENAFFSVTEMANGQVRAFTITTGSQVRSYVIDGGAIRQLDNGGAIESLNTPEPTKAQVSRSRSLLAAAQALGRTAMPYWTWFFGTAVDSRSIVRHLFGANSGFEVRYGAGLEKYTRILSYPMGIGFLLAGFAPAYLLVAFVSYTLMNYSFYRLALGNDTGRAAAIANGLKGLVLSFFMVAPFGVVGSIAGLATGSFIALPFFGIFSAAMLPAGIALKRLQRNSDAAALRDMLAYLDRNGDTSAGEMDRPDFWHGLGMQRKEQVLSLYLAASDRAAELSVAAVREELRKMLDEAQPATARRNVTATPSEQPQAPGTVQEYAPATEPMVLLLLGAPGAGKGTHGELLAQRIKAKGNSEGPVIVTMSSFLKKIAAQDTEDGRMVAKHMREGTLVPEALTTKALLEGLLGMKEEILRRGMILDGYPRNIANAQKLGNVLAQCGLTLSGAVVLGIDEDTVVKRVEMRRQQTIAAGKTPRPDDNAETARKRYSVYMEETLPVLEYLDSTYKNDRNVRIVNVDLSETDDIEKNFAKIASSMEEAGVIVKTPKAAPVAPVAPKEYVTAKQPFVLLLLGAPGAGKGTHGALLAERLRSEGQTEGPVIVTMSTFLKRIAQQDTDEGRLVAKHMKEGTLVPEALTTKALVDGLKELKGDILRRGMILDGYPRNIDNARKLRGVLEECGIRLSGAVVLGIDEETVVKRVEIRRQQTIAEGKTPRPDDNAETARKRYGVYTNETLPGIGFLQQEFKGDGEVRFVNVDFLPEDDIETNFSRIADGMEKAGLIREKGTVTLAAGWEKLPQDWRADAQRTAVRVNGAAIRFNPVKVAALSADRQERLFRRSVNRLLFRVNHPRLARFGLLCDVLSTLFAPVPAGADAYAALEKAVLVPQAEDETAATVEEDTPAPQQPAQEFTPKKKPFVLLLLGAPGAGKGTHGELLAQRLKADGQQEGPVIVTMSSFLKRIARQDTEEGRLVARHMKEGTLVPEALTTKALVDGLMELKGEVLKRGMILDGYPRNIDNARKLRGVLEQCGLTLSGAVVLGIDEETVVKRVEMRREQTIAEGKTPRPDDNAETARRRYNVYTAETLPAIEYLNREYGDSKDVKIVSIDLSESDDIEKNFAKITGTMEGAGLIGKKGKAAPAPAPVVEKKTAAEFAPAKDPLVMLLLGAPGAGKGTHGELLAQRIKADGQEEGPVIVTMSSFLKKIAAQDTEDGRMVAKHMREGTLVPEALTTKALLEGLLGMKEEILRRGMILDGYPRNIANAQKLDEVLAQCGLKLSGAVVLGIDEDTVVKRVEMRREQTIAAGKTPRPDDNAETARKRYSVYMEETLPVLEYLDNKYKDSREVGIVNVDLSETDDIEKNFAKIASSMVEGGLIVRRTAQGPALAGGLESLPKEWRTNGKAPLVRIEGTELRFNAEKAARLSAAQQRSLYRRAVNRLLYRMNHPGIARFGLLCDLLSVLFAPVSERYNVGIFERVEDGKPFTVWHFEDTEKKASFDVVPGYANKVISFNVNGREILYSDKITASGGIEPFPVFIDRVEDGTFVDPSGNLKDVRGDRVKVDADGIPYHGPARKLPWKLQRISTDRTGALSVEAVFDYGDYPDIAATYGSATVTALYRLSDGTLGVRQTVRNAGTAPAVFSPGIHQWFKRGDGNWSGTVTMDSRSIPKTDRNLIASGLYERVDPRTVYDLQKEQSFVLFDRAHLDEPAATVTARIYDRNSGVEITQRQQGAPFGTVWVPTDAKSKALSPFFAFVEALASNVNAMNYRRYEDYQRDALRPVVLAPGLSHTVAMELSVRTLLGPDGKPLPAAEVLSGKNTAEATVQDGRAELAAEKADAAILARKFNDEPLDAKGDAEKAKAFLRGGFEQEGYGVAEGAVINGSFGFRGTQGYYTKDAKGNETGKKAFTGSVKKMRAFFVARNRAIERNYVRGLPFSGKVLYYGKKLLGYARKVMVLIKTGIGGQHTPFQGIADGFMSQGADGTLVSGEYELGKDYESALLDLKKSMGLDWDQIAIDPSSKSGSTDETMLIFSELMYLKFKHVASDLGVDGARFADTVYETLHEVNFIDGKERPGKDLFKIEKERFGTTSLIDLVAQRSAAQDLSLSREQVRTVFAKVLGSMLFETTDRAEQSRLSAFVRNSGLMDELGADAPAFVEMFDNVGGRWTADLHMMAFLAFYGLDAEKYWEERNRGIAAVRAGNHRAVELADRICDTGVTDIALVVPDWLFWFGKSIEQNFNESIWQEGFANLVTVRQSHWEAQKKNYENNPKRMILNLSDLAIEGANVETVKVPALEAMGRQELAGAFADLATLFYGMTSTTGNRLIVRALARAGYTASDVDLNDVNNPATKIVQANLYLRQPYVELGKGLLEARLKALQEEEGRKPGAIAREFAAVQKKAKAGELTSNVEGLSLPKNVRNFRDLAQAMKAAHDYAERTGRKFVPFIYLEGQKFHELRDYLASRGIEWIMQGTGDQHISYQQVLAQPQKYLPFIVSFMPDRPQPGRRAIGFAKGYLDNVSPNMVRDFFAEASYQALTARRAAQGGQGFFLRLSDNLANRAMIKDAAATALGVKPAGVTIQQGRAARSTPLAVIEQLTTDAAMSEALEKALDKNAGEFSALLAAVLGSHRYDEQAGINLIAQALADVVKYYRGPGRGNEEKRVAVAEKLFELFFNEHRAAVRAVLARMKALPDYGSLPQLRTIVDAFDIDGRDEPGLEMDQATGKKSVLFKEQDVRGCAGTELTRKNVRCLAAGYAAFLREKLGKKELTVVIGRDVRISSPAVFDAIVDALRREGVRVLAADTHVTTPLLYWSVGRFQADAGIMVTASHLAALNNGLKFAVRSGGQVDNVTSAELTKIFERASGARAAYSESSYEATPVTGAVELLAPHGEYHDYIKDVIRKQMPDPADPLPLNGRTIVIDPGNGASTFMADVLTELGADVVNLYNVPDGTFPNHMPDPDHKENIYDLQAKVRAVGADLGIAFDSDGDRVGFVDSDGRRITGNEVLMLLAQDRLARPEFRDRKAWVVANNRASHGIAMIAGGHGGSVEYCPTGYVEVKAAAHRIEKNGGTVCFAGEESGHIMFPENSYFDDGAYTAALMIGIMAKNRSSLDDMIKKLPHRTDNYVVLETLHLPFLDRRDGEQAVKQKFCYDRYTDGDKRYSGIYDGIVALYSKNGGRVEVNYADRMGVRMEIYDARGDWKAWFLVKGSLTGPEISFNMEARSLEDAREIAADVLAALRGSAVFAAHPVDLKAFEALVKGYEEELQVRPATRAPSDQGASGAVTAMSLSAEVAGEAVVKAADPRVVFGGPVAGIAGRTVGGENIAERLAPASAGKTLFFTDSSLRSADLRALAGLGLNAASFRWSGREQEGSSFNIIVPAGSGKVNVKVWPKTVARQNGKTAVELVMSFRDNPTADAGEEIFGRAVLAAIAELSENAAVRQEVFGDRAAKIDPVVITGNLYVNPGAVRSSVDDLWRHPLLVAMPVVSSGEGAKQLASWEERNADRTADARYSIEKMKELLVRVVEPEVLRRESLRQMTGASLYSRLCVSHLRRDGIKGTLKDAQKEFDDFTASGGYGLQLMGLFVPGTKLIDAEINGIDLQEVLDQEIYEQYLGGTITEDEALHREFVRSGRLQRILARFEELNPDAREIEQDVLRRLAAERNLTGRLDEGDLYQAAGKWTVQCAKLKQALLYSQLRELLVYANAGGRGRILPEVAAQADGKLDGALAAWCVRLGGVRLDLVNVTAFTPELERTLRSLRSAADEGDFSAPVIVVPPAAGGEELLRLCEELEFTVARRMPIGSTAQAANIRGRNILEPYVEKGMVFEVSSAEGLEKVLEGLYEKAAGAEGLSLPNVRALLRGRVSEDPAFVMPSEGRSRMPEGRMRVFFRGFAERVVAKLNAAANAYAAGLRMAGGIDTNAMTSAEREELSAYNVFESASGKIGAYGIGYLALAAERLMESGELAKGDNAERLFREAAAELAFLSDRSAKNKQQYKAMERYVEELRAAAAGEIDPQKQQAYAAQLASFFRGVSGGINARGAENLFPNPEDLSAYRALAVLLDSYGREQGTLGEADPRYAAELDVLRSFLESGRGREMDEATFELTAKMIGQLKTGQVSLSETEIGTMKAWVRTAGAKKLYAAVILARVLVKQRSQQGRTLLQIQSEVEEIVNPFIAAVVRGRTLSELAERPENRDESLPQAWAVAGLLELFTLFREDRPLITNEELKRTGNGILGMITGIKSIKSAA